MVSLKLLRDSAILCSAYQKNVIYGLLITSKRLQFRFTVIDRWTVIIDFISVDEVSSFEVQRSVRWKAESGRSGCVVSTPVFEYSFVGWDLQWETSRFLLIY